MVNLTNRELDFLSNEGLVNILRSVLDEIDIVASSEAHRSTTYLAVSAIEGLFRELIGLLKIEPTSIPPGVWPNRNKRPKKVSELVLADMESILNASGALPPDFEKHYDLIRNYRNYMHPAQELRDLKPITRSVGQLALACLNALIERYRPLRFAAARKWLLIYGIAQVPETDVIHMPQVPGDPVSLLVTDEPASCIRGMLFRVNIPRDAIFNFVYNYSSLDKFMAARIEGREGTKGTNRKGYDNGRILCTKWRAWGVNGAYTSASEPSPSVWEHSVQIEMDPPGTFKMIVDQVPLELEGGISWGFDPQGKLGFMTEHGVVSIKDLQVEAW